MVFVLDWEEYWFQNMMYFYNKYKNICNLKFTEIWLSSNPNVTQELIKKHPEFTWYHSETISKLNDKKIIMETTPKIIREINTNNISHYLKNNLDLLIYIDINFILKNLDDFMPLFNTNLNFTIYLCHNKTITFDFVRLYINHKWYIKSLVKNINFNSDNFIEEFKEILEYTERPNFNLVFSDGTGHLQDLNELFYYLYQNPSVTFECLKKLEIHLQDEKLIYNSFRHRIFDVRTFSFEIFDKINRYTIDPWFSEHFNHIITNDFELEKTKYIERIKKEKYKLICDELYSVFLHPDNIKHFMKINDEFYINL